MKAFRFRLQTLQQLREQTRDAAQRRLVEAQKKRAIVEQQSQEVSSELQGLEQHMRNKVSGKQVDVDRIMDGHRHQLSLQAKLAELNKAITEANDEVAECREKLIEADRQVKVLEKLHERQLSDHQKQIQAHEAKLLDEAATIRAGRQVRTA